MRPNTTAIAAGFQKRWRWCARWCGCSGSDSPGAHTLRYDRAYERLMAACESGEAASECFTGFTYLYGRGHHNPGLAAKWFSMGALRGDRACQWFLGELYSTGVGLAADPVQAYVWTTRAAESGLAPAAREAAAQARSLTREQLRLAQSFLGGDHPLAPRLAYACA